MFFGQNNGVRLSDSFIRLTETLYFSLFGWLVGFLTSSSATRLYGISRTDPRTERLTILRAATHETAGRPRILSQPVTLQSVL